MVMGTPVPVRLSFVLPFTSSVLTKTPPHHVRRSAQCVTRIAMRRSVRRYSYGSRTDFTVPALFDVKGKVGEQQQLFDPYENWWGF